MDFFVYYDSNFLISSTHHAAYSFIMCHKIGIPPISITGFGRKILSSLIRDPNPPANSTTFIVTHNFACKVTKNI